MTSNRKGTITEQQRSALDRFLHRVAALRSKPKRVAAAIGLFVLTVALGQWAWRYHAPEIWVDVSPRVRVAIDAPQRVSVTLKYRPRFLGSGQARSIAGTIQLLSFPQSVVVAPTTIVTSDSAPEAVFTVRGLRVGAETLDFAGSNTPTEASSWRTASTRAVVLKAQP